MTVYDSSHWVFNFKKVSTKLTGNVTDVVVFLIYNVLFHFTQLWKICDSELKKLTNTIFELSMMWYFFLYENNLVQLCLFIQFFKASNFFYTSKLHSKISISYP